MCVCVWVCARVQWLSVSYKLICLSQSRVTGPSVSHNRQTTPSHAHAHTHTHTQSHTHKHTRTHTESHLPYNQMGLCPPSPDKLSLGPQINIQAKHWLYIIESWCHECTTGATLDAATMCAHTDTHRHTPTSTLGCQLRSGSCLLVGGRSWIQNLGSPCTTLWFMVDFTF